MIEFRHIFSWGMQRVLLVVQLGSMYPKISSFLHNSKHSYPLYTCYSFSLTIREYSRSLGSPSYDRWRGKKWKWAPVNWLSRKRTHFKCHKKLQERSDSLIKSLQGLISPKQMRTWRNITQTIAKWWREGGYTSHFSRFKSTITDSSPNSISNAAQS